MKIAATLAFVLISATAAFAATQAAASSGPKTVLLPSDTEIHLQLAETISSQTAKAGEIVRFRTVGDTKLHGVLIVPDGTEADGVVVGARRKGYMGRKGLLDVEVQFLRMDHGIRVTLDGTIEQDGNGSLSRTRALAGVVSAAFPSSAIVFTEGTPVTAFVDHDTTVPIPN